MNLQKFSFKRLISFFRSRKKKPVTVSEIKKHDDILNINVTYSNDPYQVLQMSMKHMKKNNKFPSYVYDDNILVKLSTYNVDTYTEESKETNISMLKEVFNAIYSTYGYETVMKLGFVEVTLVYTIEYTEVINDIISFGTIVYKDTTIDPYTCIIRITYADIYDYILSNMYTEQDDSIIVEIINNILQTIPNSLFKDLRSESITISNDPIEKEYIPAIYPFELTGEFENKELTKDLWILTIDPGNICNKQFVYLYSNNGSKYAEKFKWLFSEFDKASVIKVDIHKFANGYQNYICQCSNVNDIKILSTLMDYLYTNGHVNYNVSDFVPSGDYSKVDEILS